MATKDPLSDNRNVEVKFGLPLRSNFIMYSRIKRGMFEAAFLLSLLVTLKYQNLYVVSLCTCLFVGCWKKS